VKGAAMAKLKIAVIDDATMIRDLIKKFIRQNFPDADIYDANNGQTGMAMLQRQSIDLILCDWEMPEMDGEELLTWVREQDNLKNVPFIMVTSRGDKEFVVKAIQSGVSDYLVKPFNNKQFLEKVYKALKRHGIDMPSSMMASKPPTGRGGDSLAVLTAGASSGKPKAPKVKKPMAKGTAILRTPYGEVKCVLKQLDLTSMLGMFKFIDYMPAMLEQVSMDIEFDRDGEQKVMRINGFVQMLKANDNRPDCEIINVKIIFMDEDPEKRALISEYVGQFK
jgi:DNA-binding response OmpR family regulator